MLHGTKVSYIVKASRRAKRVRLMMYHDKSIVITRPYGISEGLVERFMREKAEWILRKLKRLAEYTVVRSSAAHYATYRDEARQFIEMRIRYLNAFYGFEYKKITIRAQRTRWGSCSQDKCLNFNYRIMFLPPHIADYIIVHELCHLKQFDHSERFWSLVARAIPDHRETRKALGRILIS